MARNASTPILTDLPALEKRYFRNFSIILRNARSGAVKNAHILSISRPIARSARKNGVLTVRNQNSAPRKIPG